MLFERELLKRIPRYEADGLLDSDSAARLAAHLSAVLNRGTSPFFNAVYFAGAILLIVSVCLFVNNVWDGLSVGVRLGLAFVPLAVSFILGLWALLFGRGAFMHELAAVAAIVSFGTLFCLVAGVLNIEDNFHDYSVLMICLSLPLVFVFDSRAAAMVVAIWCSIVADFGYSDNLWGVGDAFFAAAVFAVVFVYTFKNWRDAGIPNFVLGLVVCGYLASLSYNVPEMFVRGFCPLLAQPDLPNLYAFYSCAMFGAAAVMLSWASRWGGLPLWKVPQLYVGLVLMFGAMTVLNRLSCFKSGIFCESAEKIVKLHSVSIPAALVLDFVLVAVFVVWILSLVRALCGREKIWGALIAGLMFPLYFAALFGRGGYFLFVVLSNAVFFASAAAFAFSGIRRRSFLLLNIGVAMIVWQGFIRLVAMDSAIFFRAAFFGVCGFVLIGANYFLKRRLCNEK